MKKSVKLIILCVTLVCCIMLSACSKDKSIFKVNYTGQRNKHTAYGCLAGFEGYVLVTRKGRTRT